jgi:DNA helicase-2/ATP-dependent DNA helicase PcrA
MHALTGYNPGKTWEQGFFALLRTIIAITEQNLTPSNVYDKVIEYYLPIFEKIYYDDYPKRRKDLDQISALIGGYGDLQSFVDDTALDPPENDSNPGDEDSGRLVLSTIHSAKGLEWEAVFVMGLAEGRFPHHSAMPGEHLEEERRLLYVAATRAEKQLFLTYPCEIVSPDRQRQRTGMSPFLREIPNGLYLEEEDSSGQPFSFSTSEDHSLPSFKKKKMAASSFTPGMIVRHNYFGQGKIKQIPGAKRIEVAFDRHGTKILHLDYANLEIVSD